MQRRWLYSLLLTSFMLVFAFSFSMAQTVTFDDRTAKRGEEQTLNITVDPTVDISAFEIVFEVTSATGGAYFDALAIEWDTDFDALGVLDHRFIDLTGFTPGVPPGTVRIAGMMIDDGDACLGTGETIVAQVRYTTNNVCDGTVDLDGTTLSITKCNSCVIEAMTQFIECSYTITMPATVEPGTVTIVNIPPVITEAIADTTMDWGDTYQNQIVADDDDLHTVPGGYETLHYSKVMPGSPDDLQVNATTGAITWHTLGTDVGNNQVIVEVMDECSAFDRDTFNICVWNDPPVIICPEEVTNGIWGYDITGTVDAYDPDGKPDSTHGGPNALNFFFVSLTNVGTGLPAPGVVDVEVLTGDWTWHTEELPDYVGDFELCLMVTDNANTDDCSPENADTCCLDIHMISTGDVVIEKTHNSMMGKDKWVEITMENSSLELGGFDFLIKYDQSALAFMTAVLGAPLDGCDWEYFTYREGPNGNCGPNACPTGIVRLVAIAEMNNGIYHPTCFKGPDYTEWVMAKMQFMVTSDLNFECQYAPITWIWYDCGDNGISSVTGDTLFISRDVFTYEGDPSDLSIDGQWPNQDGALSPECDTQGGPDKPFPIRLIDYHHGGIDIICVDSLDDRGDINLNGNSYEVADAVLFCNYFVYGLGVFDVNADGQVAATDVNADGLTLSVADLVYLIRVIIGDAIPYSPSGFVKLGAAVEANYRLSSDGVLSMTGAEIGAVALTVTGSGTPQLLADGMEMLYGTSEGQMRILVYSLDGHGFEGECVRIDGEVTSIEAATVEARPVLATMLPTEFELHQNYPNPFNPQTTMTFSLPVASDYVLSIYNVSGQKVTEFAGHESAGKVSIEWNASNLASGIYFYKLQADGFSATKKMVLLK